MKTCTKCGIEKELSEFARTIFGRRADCKECHNKKVAEWRKSNADKIKQYSKKYVEDGRVNYEKKRASNAKWQAENLDKHRESSRRYYENNKEKVRETNDNYDIRHPECKRTIKMNRRAREAEVGGTIKPSEWVELCNKYDNTCLCCGKKNVALTLDHVIPVSKKGPNVIENAQPLCQSCNSKKHTKTIDYRKGN